MPTEPEGHDPTNVNAADLRNLPERSCGTAVRVASVMDGQERLAATRDGDLMTLLMACDVKE